LDQNLFVLYGGNGLPTGEAGRLVAHTFGAGNPSVSATRVNVANPVLGPVAAEELPATVTEPVSTKSRGEGIPHSPIAVPVVLGLVASLLHAVLELQGQIQIRVTGALCTCTSKVRELLTNR
jgi:hypothetical protein